MLPVDWRERFTAAVRGEGEIDPGLFEARPLLAPERQLQIYQEQYRLRTDEAFLEEIPGLAHLLGEERALELTTAWLRDHPPRTWTLADIASGFADWLDARGEAPGHVDMARLDAAVSRGFTAAEPRDLLTTELAPQLRLRLSPPTSLLRLRSNAHQVRLALLTDTPPPALREADVPLAIYRGTDLQMRHLEIEPGLWGLLSALPASVESAVEAALREPRRQDGIEIPAEALAIRARAIGVLTPQDRYEPSHLPDSERRTKETSKPSRTPVRDGDAAESNLPVDGARLAHWFSTAAQRRLVEPVRVL